jgi:hypothetical protein
MNTATLGYSNEKIVAINDEVTYPIVKTLQTTDSVEAIDQFMTLENELTAQGYRYARGNWFDVRVPGLLTRTHVNEFYLFAYGVDLPEYAYVVGKTEFRLK